MSDINDVIREEYIYMQQMGQDTRQNVGRCNHCGNITVHLTQQIYNHKDDDAIHYYMNEEKIDQTNEFAWFIQECMNCKGFLLKEWRSYIDDIDDYYHDEYKILYPATKAVSDSLPSAVKKVFEKALNVKDEPNSFAFLAGQTLESVCRHEQAQGESLYEKLNYLAQKDRIPKTLADMAHQVRLLRNLAVHDAENEVTEKDVPITLEFLEAILEYLYVAPAKIKAVQERLRKKTTKASDE
jgi:Domain of unknown function (DUF4145)